MKLPKFNLKSTRAMLRSCSFILLLTIFSNSVVAQSLVVKADKPITDIKPTMWGIFFEDINFAADGGIYAELIKNRSFEFFNPLMGWKEHKTDRYSVNAESGYTTILNRGEQGTSNPRFARVVLTAEKGYGLTNEGFRGMGVKKDLQYNFSMMASLQEGNTRIRLELVSSKGNILAEASVSPAGKEWKKYTASFKSAETDAKAKLNIWFEGKGIVDLDMISLFPGDTWKNRPNGLRSDLVQLLADLKPGFVRFPGGCIVEGRELANRYQWKKTVGDIGDREMIVNRWNTEFSHRSTPDYFQTFGLGFFEYFQLAEDIGAEPLPILSCGMACQFNTAELVPLDQLDPYINDALDLVEFANGAPTTKWGKVRADMGHPQPFNLKYIGVGNEQWGPQYIERYKIFVKAIKAKYPDIIIVTGSGPFPDGELFDYAYKELKALNAEIVDEHYYRSPEWFMQNISRYDSYDRKGPKVFAGEYAAHSGNGEAGEKRSIWRCSLAEAAFMTGLERNADIVHLSSYAPLFAHAEAWQWAPDLIWFDNLRSYGTPSYYVQKLFSVNKGSTLVPMTYQDAPVTGQEGLYASAVTDKNTKEVILKIVNTTHEVRNKEVLIEGVRKLASSANVTVLKSDKLDALNSLDEPTHIAPTQSTVAVKGNKVNVSIAPYSLSVVRVKMM